jgi:hypothetical protein
MKGHIQRCQELVAHLGTQFKSVAIASPRTIFYGIVLMVFASWIVLRATQYLKKPTEYATRTPDIERRGSYFKTPPRTPGGLSQHVLRMAVTDNQQYGNPRTSNGRLLLQLQIGMSIPRDQNLTALSGMGLTTSLWGFGT